jgi:hypothetical protein
LRTRWVRCRSWGSRSQDSFERKGRKRVAASLAPLRPRCSTVSNSEEYEVESSAASKALVPVRSGSTAVVPEPASPLRSTSFPDRRRGFRPRWSPHALEPSASGRTMMRRVGTSGCSADPETNGSTRDPQLPWGSCCIRKTFWRLPAFYSTRYRHTQRSWKFSGSPLQDARLGHPLRSSLPCHRTIKEPSTRAVFSSFLTRLGGAGPASLALPFPSYLGLSSRPPDLDVIRSSVQGIQTLAHRREFAPHQRESRPGG